jgi:hypothetical protein
MRNRDWGTALGIARTKSDSSTHRGNLAQAKTLSDSQEHKWGLWTEMNA